MPSTQLEVFYQDPKVLIVADNSTLAELVKNHLKEEQIGVLEQSSLQEGVLESLSIVLSEQQPYKVIVIINPTEAWGKKNIEFYKKLSELLDNSKTPQLFLLKISSKIDNSSPLFNEWNRQCEVEDELLNYLYKNSKYKKLLIAQDSTDFNGPLLYPLKSVVEAIPNGYLIDLGLRIYSQLDESFFNTIKKEILRPEKKNFVVRGKPMATDDVCNKIRLIYQSYYSKDLEVIKQSASSPTRLEKKSDLVQVVAGELPDDFFEKLCGVLPNKDLGLDPALMKSLLDNKPQLKTVNFLPQSDQAGQEHMTQAVGDGPLDFDFLGDSITKNKTQKTWGGWGSDKPQQSSTTNTTHKQPEGEYHKPTSKTNQSKSGNHEFQNKEQDQRGFSALPPNSINNQINKLFTKSRTKQKVQRRSSKARVIGKIRTKSKRKQVVFIAGACLFLLGLLFFVFLGLLSLSFKRSQQILTSNINILIEGGSKDLKETRGLETKALILDKFLGIYLIEKSLMLNSINDRILSLHGEIISSQKMSAQIFNNLFGGSDDSAQDFSMTELLKQKNSTDKSIFEKASLLQAELDSLPENVFENDLHNSLARARFELKDIRSRNTASQQINPLLTSLLGFEQKQTFYILLQDDRELRPTGGFVQAIGMIQIENGRSLETHFLSTHEVDARVFGRVAAPAEVASFLGEDSLYFRDVNWDPDFSTTSQKVSWFVGEALGQPVDGILGINYGLIRDILAVIGEIEVDGYSQTVDAWNLYNKLELLLLEEGDQEQAGSFQVGLLESIFNQLGSLSDEQITQVLEIFYSSLKNQQSLLYLNDVEAGVVVDQLNWSGRISHPDCPGGFGDYCHTDHVFQVEANIGVNKINPYINQSVSHTINIEEGRISHQRQVKFTNRARSSSWPLGSYRFYLRFFVSPESELDQLLVNGELLAEDKIVSYIDHNRKVYATVLEVGPSESLELLFNYSVPHKLDPGDAYFFYDQLQAGLKQRPTVMSLKFPHDWRAKVVSPQAEVNQNQVVITSDVGSSFIIIGFEESNL